MTLIDRQPASHWYLRDGRPFHQIAKKDGSLKAVTLADARKVLALPSVTNILGVLAKPGLDAWKIEQAIFAALTLPREADEPLDAFARRVVKDMSEQVKKAADFGTAIHAACEAYAINKELPGTQMILDFVREWVLWFDENVERIDGIEQVVVHPTALYAGRVDMVAKLKDIGWCVVDFKTQKVKRNAKGEPKAAFYETWPLQLAAYREAINASTGKNVVGLVSVVVDSVEPGPVHVKVWPQNVNYAEVFAGTYLAWKYMKCYSPGEAALNSPNPELN